MSIYDKNGVEEVDTDNDNDGLSSNDENVNSDDFENDTEGTEETPA